MDLQDTTSFATFENLAQDCRLSVEGLTLDLFIGCLPEEALQRQPVEIDFSLFFPTFPQGSRSDVLSDTVCYARCVEIVRETANKKHFQLIEHLAFEIHASLVKELPKEVAVHIRVTKLRPPVPDIKKGVSFSLRSSS